MDLTEFRIAVSLPAMEKNNEFADFLRLRTASVEQCLEGLLTYRDGEGEIARPKRLLDAMRHGVLAGGKRLRPFLVLESAALFGASEEASLRVAAALECIHCYSLIHDDLPAMDNDDMRRGRPTVHKAFDYATAILAGDSLLTFAFDIIAAPETELPATVKNELVLALSRAAGMGGMAGGQMLDLAAEKQQPDETGIVTLQAMKTGALLRFACEAGAIIADAERHDRQRMAEFGSAIGLAFQLADDLLDEIGEAASLGKATGKDARAGKATLIGLYGTEWARKQLNGLVKQANELLAPYRERGAILAATAEFIAERRM
jgi:farnesyl diphosphate synthase